MKLRSWQLWALLVSVGAIAYGLGRLETDGSATGRSESRRGAWHTPQLGDPADELTRSEPPVDSRPDRSEPKPRADRVRSSRSEEATSVEAIVRRLREAQDGKDSMRIRTLLRELQSRATPEANEALLDLLRSGDPPLRGVGELWREILSGMDDDRLPGVLENLLTNYQGRDMRCVGPLWSCLVELVGPRVGGPLVAAQLTREGLPLNSTLRMSIIKSIETDLGPVVRAELERGLSSEYSALHALGALLRAGDESSLRIAFDHLASYGPQSLNVAAQVGSRLDDDRLAELQRAAERDPRVEAVVVLALAHASPELAKRHGAAFVSLTKRVMTRTVGRTDAVSVRQYNRICHSLDEISSLANDDEFRRFLRDQVAVAPQSLRPLLLRASQP